MATFLTNCLYPSASTNNHRKRHNGNLINRLRCATLDHRPLKTIENSFSLPPLPPFVIYHFVRPFRRKSGNIISINYVRPTRVKNYRVADNCNAQWKGEKRERQRERGRRNDPWIERVAILTWLHFRYDYYCAISGRVHGRIGRTRTNFQRENENWFSHTP